MVGLKYLLSLKRLSFGWTISFKRLKTLKYYLLDIFSYNTKPCDIQSKETVLLHYKKHICLTISYVLLVGAHEKVSIFHYHDHAVEELLFLVIIAKNIDHQLNVFEDVLVKLAQCIFQDVVLNIFFEQVSFLQLLFFLDDGMLMIQKLAIFFLPCYQKLCVDGCKVGDSFLVVLQLEKLDIQLHGVFFPSEHNILCKLDWVGVHPCTLEPLEDHASLIEDQDGFGLNAGSDDPMI